MSGPPGLSPGFRAALLQKLEQPPGCTGHCSVGIDCFKVNVFGAGSLDGVDKVRSCEEGDASLIVPASCLVSTMQLESQFLPRDVCEYVWMRTS